MTARVAVIGPGRVGTALAMALAGPRYDVAWVAGRGERAVAAFLERLPGAQAVTVEAACAAADLVLVAVPDDALRGVLRGAAASGAVVPGSRWVHVAGGHGLEVLRPVRLAGARAAACHPAQTFPDPESGLRNLRGSAWAVTASDHDRAWADAFVQDCGGVAYEVADHARVRYHAGLAAGANGAAALVALARDLLLGSGIERPEAFLEPLVAAAVRGSARSGAAALTGPVRRGDAATVAAHVEEIAVTLPEALDAYRALSLLALGYARRAGLAPESADAVERALQ